jgi:hypothetical protein
VEQLKCLLSSVFIAETLEKCIVRYYIRRAAKLRHSSEQNAHGLAHPLCVIEALEQSIDDYYIIHPPARLKDEAKGGEAMLQTAHAAEAADEDAVGENIRSHLAAAVTDHPVEAGDDEL